MFCCLSRHLQKITIKKLMKTNTDKYQVSRMRIIVQLTENEYMRGVLQGQNIF
jgi:hypothetical protein